MRSCAALKLWLLWLSMSLVVVAAGCPPPEDNGPKKPPPRGFALSTPFPDVRSLSDIAFIGDGVAFAVGTDGTVLRRDFDVPDGEDSKWEREDTGVDADLESVSGFIDPTTTDDRGNPAERVLAVGAAGTVISRNADGTWTVLPTGAPADDLPYLFGVAYRSLTDALIVGDNGKVFRYNGTAVAQQIDETVVQEITQPSGPPLQLFIPETLKSVAYDGGTAFAAGSSGAVYRFDADAAPGSGARWTREVTETTRSLSSVFTRAGIAVTGTDGVIFRRNDVDSWDQDFRTPIAAFLQDVWASGGSDVFAVGFSEFVFHFDGSVWTLAKIEDEQQMRAIDGTILPANPDADRDEDERIIVTVGGGGRIIRGPDVVAEKGERLLKERIDEPDAAQ